VGDLEPFELDREQLSTEERAMLGALMSIEDVTQGILTKSSLSNSQRDG
jgi:hypothetical protein